MNLSVSQRVSRIMRLAPSLLVASVFLAPSPARAQVDPATLPPGAEIELRDEPAEGTTVRRGVSRFVVPAPMADVVRAFTDYPRYTELLPRVTTSRVVRRTRAGTEVYLQVNLGGNLGALWSRVRVSVQRAPQRVTVTGTNLDGNLDRFEFSAQIDAVAGDPARTLLECRMLSIPQLPFPSTVFTRENLHALSTMANLVRSRVSAPAPTVPEAPALAPTAAPGSPAESLSRQFPQTSAAPTSPSP